MRKTIIDEFTSLLVSRQRKSQLRRIRDGLCPICGQPKLYADKNHFCEYHYQKHLEHVNRFNRKRNKILKKEVREVKKSLGIKPTERAGFNVWKQIQGQS